MSFLIQPFSVGIQVKTAVAVIITYHNVFCLFYHFTTLCTEQVSQNEIIMRRIKQMVKKLCTDQRKIKNMEISKETKEKMKGEIVSHILCNEKRKKVKTINYENGIN